MHHHYQQSAPHIYESSFLRNILSSHSIYTYVLQQHIHHKFPLDRQWKCLTAIDTKSKYWAISTWSKSNDIRIGGLLEVPVLVTPSEYPFVRGACRYTKLLEEYWRLCSTIACYNPWDFVECTFPLRPIIIQEIMFYFPLCPIILVIPEVLFYLSIISCYSPRYFVAFSSLQPELRVSAPALL